MKNRFNRSFGFLMIFWLLSISQVHADMQIEPDGPEEPFEITYTIKGLDKFTQYFDFYYSDKLYGKNSKIFPLIDKKPVKLMASMNWTGKIYIWALNKKTKKYTQCYTGNYGTRFEVHSLSAIKYNVLLFDNRITENSLEKSIPFFNWPGNNRDKSFLLVSLTAFLALVFIFFRNKNTSSLA
jgi:hypothetical protein